MYQDLSRKLDELNNNSGNNNKLLSDKISVGRSVVVAAEVGSEKVTMSQRDRVVDLIIERGSRLWGKAPSDLSEDTRFAEDVNAKSVHIAQITTYLEDELGIEVPFLQFMRRKTIGEAADYVCEFLDEDDDNFGR